MCPINSVREEFIWHKVIPVIDGNLEINYTCLTVVLLNVCFHIFLDFASQIYSRLPLTFRQRCFKFSTTKEILILSYKQLDFLMSTSEKKNKIGTLKNIAYYGGKNMS